MGRATTLVVALLTCVLLLHTGVPHCGMSAAADGIAAASDQPGPEPVTSTAPGIGHLLEADSIALPVRDPRLCPDRQSGSDITTAPIQVDGSALTTRAHRLRTVRPGYTPGLAVLQTFRC